jgi:subtilisin family serine protease
MQVSLSNGQLNTYNPGRRRIERPTDYVGPLETTGKDVVVAVIDSGIAKHPDLLDSIAVAVTFDKDRAPSADDWGHGTATASVIAGNGSASNGEFKGVAPGAKLINLPVFTKEANESGQAGFHMLNALNWVVDNKDKFNIRVVNVSGGMPLLPDPDNTNEQMATFLDPFDAAIKRAVEAGIVVVAAAGNTGPGPSSISSSPGHHPDVITVGSLDTNGTPEDLSDDFVATHSSRGPGPLGNGKPDLVAPGVGLTLAAVPGSQIMQDNEARAALYAKLRGVDQQSLLPAVGQLVMGRQLSPRLFESALPQLEELLPERMKATLANASVAKRTATALQMSAVLSAKGLLDTEGQPYREAAEALRQAMDRMAPAPIMQSSTGETMYLAEDGTSFATPIVTSVIAHMLEVNPALTPAQVKDILKNTARPVPGADQYSAGAGALNAQAAIEQARTLAS